MNSGCMCMTLSQTCGTVLFCLVTSKSTITLGKRPLCYKFAVWSVAQQQNSWCGVQGNAADAQGFLIRLLQIGFATGSLVAAGILLLQVRVTLEPSKSPLYHKAVPNVLIT